MAQKKIPRHLDKQQLLAAVEPDHPVLPISRQCALLGIARSSFYYQPAVPNLGKKEQEGQIRLLMDQMYTQDPSLGVERMWRQLNTKTQTPVNIKRVRRMYRAMGLVSLAPGPHTSKPAPEHKTYPYLLKSISIDAPDLVWCTDITYLPMAQGHFFMTAIMDWHTRAILSWRISNTMTTHFCLEALTEAIQRYGPPQIMNTDQGSQYTSQEWIAALEDHQVKISMDGKGRAIDNVRIERFWRSYKYEYLYLAVHNTGQDLKKGTAKWVEQYNNQRIHSALQEPPLANYEKTRSRNSPPKAQGLRL